ncbi:MAG: hypothetical protein ACRDF4_08125, partial [Rhabdochlamydiaceae bacterium]
SFLSTALCKQLEELDLTKCGTLTDENLQKISSTNLKVLFAAFTKISEVPLHADAFKTLTQLCVDASNVHPDRFPEYLDHALVNEVRRFI